MSKLIIVGGFHEIIELLEDESLEIEGIIDSKLFGSFRGYPIIGNDSDVEKLAQKFGLSPLIITPDSPKIRKKLVEKYSEYGFVFYTLISSSAKISKSATVGHGTVVQFGVNISANAKIGEFVKLNTLCNVMHDVVIGNFTTVAPNAVLLGYVNVGENCYIGANATILPNISIGNNAVVGASSVVTHDVPDGIVVAGNPARELIK